LVLINTDNLDEGIAHFTKLIEVSFANMAFLDKNGKTFL
jgi:hypothetical protein